MLFHNKPSFIELEQLLAFRVGSLEEKKSVNILQRIVILVITIIIACYSRYIIIHDFKDETIVLYWSIVVCCVPVAWYIIECYYLSVRRRAEIAYFWYKREEDHSCTSKWSRMDLIIQADEELQKHRYDFGFKYDPECPLSFLQICEGKPEMENCNKLIRIYSGLLKATEMEHTTLRSMFSPIITCIFIAVEVILICWLIF